VSVCSKDRQQHVALLLVLIQVGQVGHGLHDCVQCEATMHVLTLVYHQMREREMSKIKCYD
jgi:hypothetical protein